MNLSKDSTYFLELQTNTGWGRMLKQFAEWCAPQPGWRTLDAGCGPGLFPALLEETGALAIGTDIDPENFAIPQHTRLCAADASLHPFPPDSFDLITASNLLFLLPEPLKALRELARLTRSGGQICLLNPSEHMSTPAATELADKAELTGLARDTLLNYALRAERYVRWTEDDLADLFAQVGMQLIDTKTAMGPGLVRFARAAKLQELGH